MVTESVTSFTNDAKHESFRRLQHHIQTNDHFFIGRLSGNETAFCGTLLSNKQVSNSLVSNMLFGAGIQFTSNPDVTEYVRLYTNACKNCDMLGVWDGNMYLQAKPFYDFFNKVCPGKRKLCAHSLEPYYFTDLPDYSFSKAFENKKVLVITSHEKTTLSQIPHIHGLFPKPIFHETTEFHVYKPPQQNGGNHDTNSWQHHFQKMQTDLTNIDFDIALVSCGGFGMPICDYIFTNLNKSVIYVGGALQLYFGINGKRWLTSPEINRLQTDKWTRPLPEDAPVNPNMCEGGCYW
jgi:hypothetical protein